MTLGSPFMLSPSLNRGHRSLGLYSKGLPETTPAQRNSTCSTRFPTPDIGLSRCLEPSRARITNGELPVLPVLPQALLALADGTVFSGSSIGATGHTVGGVVFNPSLCGYQEILTAASDCQQSVTQTYPHIGNYGVNHEDVEAMKVHPAGLIIKHLPLHVSNFRHPQTLAEDLQSQGTAG